MTNSDGGAARDSEPPTDSDERWRQVTQRHFDPDEEPDLTTTLVSTIADAKDVPPTELKSPPLYEVVDAAAIQNTLFDSNDDFDSKHDNGRVEFRYDDLFVKVSGDGWIQVYENNETDVR